MDLRSAQKWVQEWYLRINKFPILGELVLRHGEQKLWEQKLRNKSQKLMGVKMRERGQGLQLMLPLVWEAELRRDIAMILELNSQYGA